MQITKKEDSVLVELSQAELSAIKMMAERSLESASRVLAIDFVDHPEACSAYNDLTCCYELLKKLGMNAESDISDMHAFCTLFMPMAIEEPEPLFTHQ